MALVQIAGEFKQCDDGMDCVGAYADTERPDVVVVVSKKASAAVTEQAAPAADEIVGEWPRKVWEAR